MRILITIPAWNEAVVIERTLRDLTEAIQRFLGEHEVAIEVADNGSTDGTDEIVRQYVHRHQDQGGHEAAPVRLLVLGERGKGIAIRRSWERHLDDADILAFMDADLATDVRSLPDLIQPLVEDRADLVCGSRFLPGAEVERGWIREGASRLYRLLQRAILHLPVRDAQCGFKAVRVSVARRILPQCQEKTWLFDSELLAWVAHLQARIVEIPVSWEEPRTPERRSTINVLKHGWGFVGGLIRIKKRLK